MNPRRAVAALLVVAVALSGVFVSQRAMNCIRTKEFDEQLLYLPNEKLLNYFTAGLSGVVADVLWLKCIQYTSKHFRGDLKFTWLGNMCDVVTRLDPYFLDAYRYGGIFLAALKADDDASIRLMERGIAYLPDRWELPYEIAMVYLMNRRDQSGAPETAAAYMNLAVATGTAPQNIVETAQGLQRKNNLPELERRMWADMAEHHSDKLMRDLARRKLALLDIYLACEKLQGLADDFAKRSGRPPKTIEDFAKPAPGQSTTDALGGRFFVDAQGKVKNTSLLDDSVERLLTRVRGGVALYEKRFGTPPPTLDAIVENDLMRSIPPHPYEGRAWRYAPTTGEVNP